VRARFTSGGNKERSRKSYVCNGDPEKEKLLSSKTVELELAYQKSVLLAPSAVQEPLANLVSFCQEMVTSYTDPEQWLKMVADHSKLVNRVMRAAQVVEGSARPLGRQCLSSAPPVHSSDP
jgi:hypothetical protein